MEKEYVVPEGMLKAAIASVQDGGFDRYRVFLEAALRWLAENPMYPSFEQITDMAGSRNADARNYVESGAIEWQRRMFLEPESDKRTRILHIVQDIAAGRDSSVNIEQWADAIMDLIK